MSKRHMRPYENGCQTWLHHSVLLINRRLRPTGPPKPSQSLCVPTGTSDPAYLRLWGCDSVTAHLYDHRSQRLCPRAEMSAVVQLHKWVGCRPSSGNPMFRWLDVRLGGRMEISSADLPFRSRGTLVSHMIVFRMCHAMVYSRPLAILILGVQLSSLLANEQSGFLGPPHRAICNRFFVLW
jgi:hypothetical protein